MDRRRPTIDSGGSSCNEFLHRRTCVVFDRGVRSSPATLPAVAAAFAEYLVAWRDASPDRGPGTAASPTWLSERVSELDALLQRAEQALEISWDATPANDLGRLEGEAADILTAVRDLLGRLHHEQPAAHRLRLALVDAWGRFDDALAELRVRGHRGSVIDADVAVVAGLRDALLRHMASARAMSN
jgi:hypothetical protein